MGDAAGGRARCVGPRSCIVLTLTFLLKCVSLRAVLVVRQYWEAGLVHGMDVTH